MDIQGSFSKLSKNIIKGKDLVVQTSENLIEVSKINLDISNKKSSIEKLYKKLGKKLYKLYKKQPIKNDELEKIIKDIDKEKKELDYLENNLMKTKDKKRCKHCNSYIDNYSSFCPKCGKKQI